jgi:succinoglycan biosynthesis protein ExoL
MPLIYFTSDGTDSIAAKRIAMFEAAGEAVRCLGMVRDTNTVARVPESMRVLAHARNGRLFARLWAILRASITLITSARREVSAADVLIARNLDMLLLAFLGRLAAGNRALVYYEFLDARRQLTDNTIMGRLLRFIERRALALCEGVIVSSPAYVDHYFTARQRYFGRTRLLENKVWWNGRKSQGPVSLDERKRECWRIGYVGLLRCRKSLTTLCDLTKRHTNVELRLHGVPDQNFFPDFNALINGRSRVEYFGRFNYPADLPGIYGNVDFVWLPDFSAIGGNSEWLLPNRLYEACAFGAVPISIEGTETANWLTRLKIGIVLKKDMGTALDELFADMTAARLNRLKAAIRALPGDLFEFSAADIRNLLAWLHKNDAHVTSRGH